MRRAIIATAGTVVGLVALLDYKSSGTIHRSHVAVSGGTPAAAAPSTAPGTTTTAPSPGTASASPTAPAAPSTTTPAAASGQYTGTDVVYRYGDIVVQITVAGGRITNISIPQESARDSRSQFINGQAIPILTSEALAAQNLNFDVVSGATFTSEAFAQSLQSALTKAGK
jgi:uncharacterized protein with FMN-binding domain